MAINVWSQTAKKLGASYIGIGSGEAWFDDSGNGHTDKLFNGASITGTVLDLDGSDDYAQVTGHSDLDLTANWTLETAVTPRTDVGAGWYLNYAPVPAVNGFLLGMAGTPVSRIDWRFSENSDTISGRMPDNSVPIGATTHIIASVTGVAPNKTAIMYANGVAVSNTLLASDVPAISANLLIGRFFGGTTSGYNGKSHGVFIYPNLAMTAAQARVRYSLFLTHPTAGGGGGGG